jgi:hypothetical protein
MPELLCASGNEIVARAGETADAADRARIFRSSFFRTKAGAILRHCAVLSLIEPKR